MFATLKRLRFAILLISISQSCVSKSDAVDVTVECRYENSNLGNGFVKESFPSCNVQNAGSFIGDQVTVTGVNGVTSNDIKGFFLENAKSLTKFPRNLEKFFTNLIGISITSCNLSELSHNDLKAFPDLKYLLLYYNDIKVLHTGTFANNPNLEVIHLEGNKISHIDRSTFSHLSKLIVLCLIGNVCHFESYPTTRSGAVTYIESIQNGKCISSEYDTTTTTSTTSTSTTTENPLVAELRALKESNSALKESNSALKESNSDLLESNSALKESNSDLLESNSALVSNNTNLKQELDEKSLEIVNLGSHVANLTAELEACAIKDHQKVNFEEKLDEILSINLKLLANNERLEEKLLNHTDLRDRLDEAEEQLRIRMMEIIAIDSENKALRKELTDAQTLLDESLAEHKSGE